MEPAVHRRYQIANVGGHVHFLGSRASDSDIARSSLLQKQLGCMDDRLGMEAGAHCAAMESIIDRNQRHPLVVSHVGPDDRNRLALRKACRRVIQCLIESKCAAPSRLGKTFIVFCGRLGIEHRSQRGCVWCNNSIFAETAFESQSGNSKVRVLIGELKIADIVCGF